MHYDAGKAPDREAWLELDESERVDLVLDYHRRKKLPVGENERLHGTIHVVVENQVAMGDVTVVPATLERLMREGLKRHEAIHAIGSVVIQIVFDAITGSGAKAGIADINATYGRELAELTAASWRAI